MPLCITCAHPLPHLYTVYSKADDKSLGKGVRLTQCPNCKKFADKYVEHDYVVLFIDLVLIKPQVYRHLLFNRLNTTGFSSAANASDRLDPSILRLGILLVLFDVYITWARIEKDTGDNTTTNQNQASISNGGVLTSWPIVGQYFFFLTLNIIATLAQHFTIRLLAKYFLANSRRDSPDSSNPRPQQHSRSSSQATTTAQNLQSHQSHSRHSSTADPTSATSAPNSINNHNAQFDSSNTLLPGYASPSAISTALLVSSCTKLFPILLVIWPTTSSSSSNDGTMPVGPFASRAASYIGWVVLVNNIEALLILLDCGYVMASGLAVAGLVSRFAVEGWLFALAGLKRDSSGPVGDFAGLLVWIVKSLSGG